jgi:hypothetical protein
MKSRKRARISNRKRPREYIHDYNYFQKRTKYYHDFYPNEIIYISSLLDEEYTAYSLDFY